MIAYPIFSFSLQSEVSPKLTRQQLADYIGKDIRTIGRAITKLQQQDKLKRIGSDKTGHWEIHHE